MNIQGMSGRNEYELLDLFGRDRSRVAMFGLVETHQRYVKYFRSSEYIVVEKYREQQDKRGGGGGLHF